MTFTVRVKNPPANSVGWEGRWYVSGYNMLLVPFVANDESCIFTDAVPRPGTFYIRFLGNFPEQWALEGKRYVTAMYTASISPLEGSYWEYDYASRTMSQVSAPPSSPEVRNLEVSYARA